MLSIFLCTSEIPNKNTTPTFPKCLRTGPGETTIISQTDSSLFKHANHHSLQPAFFPTWYTSSDNLQLLQLYQLYWSSNLHLYCCCCCYCSCSFTFDFQITMLQKCPRQLFLRIQSWICLKLCWEETAWWFHSFVVHETQQWKDNTGNEVRLNRRPWLKYVAQKSVLLSNFKLAGIPICQLPVKSTEYNEYF